jgi:hypothetical protein
MINIQRRELIFMVYKTGPIHLIALQLLNDRLTIVIHSPHNCGAIAQQL